MIGRRSQRTEDEEVAKPKSFDDFELRLGDVMRGERATMGKSLLDVQRELRIKAAYIAAIENSDPSAFDTPGFIAGYVRSYARYLNMNPDEAYEVFCRESGFSVAHGMSPESSVVKKSDGGMARRNKPQPSDPLDSSPFALAGRESALAQIEPRAIGSIFVLVALLGGLGYGGWSVLREVQQVQVAPVDQTPVVLSDIDPLNTRDALSDTAPDTQAGAGAPSVEALDRLYRPQALDVPVLVARDAPISTLDPRNVGTFRAPETPQAPVLQAENTETPVQNTVPRVLEDAAPQLRMVAVRPAWVRVTSVDGTTLFEAILDAGQTFDIPATEEPPLLRVGESGAIYFDVDGQVYGPVGDRGTVTSNFALARDAIIEATEVADLDQDTDLARVVAEMAVQDNSATD